MDAPDLIGPRRLQELFARHGFRPRRSLGQNFVVDQNTIRKVVEVAGITPADRVLEIGPGAGSLTLALAAAAEAVTALEVDERLIPILNEVLAAAGNVTVVLGDALAVPLADVPATKVVANLPYNIATPVVLRILEEAPHIEELTVMTQREVGERLAAAPGSKIYGAPTVAAAFFAEASIAARVSRRAFWPVPNVDSVLVRLQRHRRVPEVDFASLAAVVRAAFGQRRKSLRNSLAGLAGGTEGAEAALRRVGIEPGTRPERVAPEAFERLTRAIGED